MVQSVSVGRKYFTLTKYGGRNVLNFFGKGSAFADDNTCAYFVDDNDMVLIDFSLEAFPKLRKLDFLASRRSMCWSRIHMEITSAA